MNLFIRVPPKWVNKKIVIFQHVDEFSSTMSSAPVSINIAVSRDSDMTINTPIIGTKTNINTADTVREALTKINGNIAELDGRATLSARTGSVAMPLVMKVAESLSITEYGARADGNIYGTEVTNACLAAGSEKKRLDIPDGSWIFSKPLVFDYQNTSEFNPGHPRSGLSGAGRSSCFITYVGTGSAVQIFGGGSGAGQECHQIIGGFTLVGPGMATDTIGIHLDHTAWPKMHDIYVTNFGTGIYGRDVEWLQAERVLSRFNGRGVTITARQGSDLDPNSSNPNGHMWLNCSIGSNIYQGMLYEYANSLNIIGGDLEYNGASSGSAGFGLKVRNGGLQGGRILNLDGCYIEHNYGLADVVLTQDDPTRATFNAAVYRISSDFKRALAGQTQTDYFVAVDFVASTGTQTIILEGNVFKNFNGITSPNSIVGFVGEKTRKDIDLIARGNVALNQIGIRQDTARPVPYAATLTTTSPSGGAPTASVVASYTVQGEMITVACNFTVSNFGANTGLIAVSLPYPVRSGTLYVAGSGVDINSGTALYVAASPGGTVATIASTPTGHTVSFSITYEAA
jgi:hypothetical protein